jgi:hypothetical protein
LVGIARGLAMDLQHAVAEVDDPVVRNAVAGAGRGLAAAIEV